MATQKTVRIAAALALVGVVLSTATGCASTGSVGNPASSRMSRFGAFPIDEEISAPSARMPQGHQTARHGYGYVGG